MRFKRSSIFASVILFMCCGLALLGGEKAMAETVLYRVNLIKDKNRSITVKQSGADLTIVLEGFGQPIALKANGGGTSTCRTIIEHNSAQATILISLAIPDPRARCRMLPSFVSIESRDFNISLDEETVKKISGGNAKLRSIVQKILGKIEEEEG